MSHHVLITGGAGFIGSRLARRLADAGHTVTVLDALIPQVHGSDPVTTSPLLRSLDGVATVIEGSVTSVDALRRAIDGVDVIVHLAAETGTGQSMYEIDRYVETNVGGTAKLLDILTNQEHTVRRLVIASSRSIYGEGAGAYRTTDGRTVYPAHREDAAMAAGDFEVHMAGEGELLLIPTDEDSKLHPSSVYGITKQMQESLIMTVAPTVGIEPVSLRYQNVYGPGQSLKNPYTGILSIFSTLVRQGKEINVFEDGLESRDFVYIDDVVEATFLAATEPAAAGGVFNVGSGVATTVNEVVAALFAAFGTEVPTRISGNYRLGDIRHNVADTSRLRDRLGFEPTVSFRDGVTRFVEWVLSEPVEGDAYERSLKEMADRKLPQMTGTRRSWIDPKDNSLNLLRLVLAAMVLVHHVIPLTGRGEGIELTPGESVGGWAVFGFFMISGYLITGARLRSDGGRYLINRIARLFPAFVFVNLLTAFALAPVAYQMQNGTLDGFLSTPNTPASYVVANMWLKMVDYSVAGTLATVPYPFAWNGSLWSLYYEFCAYLLVGLFCVIPIVRRSIWPMLIAFLLSCVLKIWNASFVVLLSGIGEDVIQFGRLLPFFFGGALVFMMRERLGERFTLSWKGALISGAATVGLVVLFPTFGGQLAAPFLTYLLIWVGARLPSPTFIQVHGFSYGVYVWGFPLTQMLCLLGWAEAALPAFLAVLVVATTVVAGISWFLVERPAIRWSRGKTNVFGDIRAEAR